MATWTTILRDLAKTAMVAAGRAAQSRRATGSGAGRIRMPDLASVDDARATGADAGVDDPADRAHDADRPRRAEPVAPPEPLDGPRDRPMRPSAGTASTGPDTTPPDTTRPDTTRPDDDPGRDRRRLDRDDDGVSSPGQLGPAATLEVDPADLDLVRTSHNPDTDGDPDPGEIVWTWVPYEERDGRGKDRPVLVVARLADDAVLAVQLSSRDHDGDRGWLALGAGDWDGEHRPSWANLDRVLLVHPDGMRREAASLDRDRFDRVAHALREQYRWTSS